jgi:hypothetical protein
MVYRGEEDKDSRWKRTVDPSRHEDVTSSQRLLERSTVILNSCNDINYGDVKTEKESEGVWYIITATCRDKKIVFAFLKIDNIFVLGDMD